jgi:hypothetical protein
LLKCKTLKDEKCEIDDFNEESVAVREMINSIGTGKPVEIRAATPKGPKITQDDIDHWNSLSDKINNTNSNVEKLDKDLD